MSAFDELLAEGESVDVSTWGAGMLAGRVVEELPPWRYPDLLRRYLDSAGSVLDLGTGDGGKLLDAAPLPAHAVACEGWAPTLPAAVSNLRPAGVAVVHCEDGPENTDPAPDPNHPSLPFRDSSFDLVVDRHTSFDPADVRRVLRPGGTFVTQQVGSRHGDEVRALLGLPPADAVTWDLTTAVEQVTDAGFELVDSGEAFPRMRWTDVGALVAYLRSIPWYVPDFTVSAYRDRLRELHESGRLETDFHLFWLGVQKAS